MSEELRVGNCKQCGMCCKALGLSVSPQELVDMSGNSDVDFIKKHFHYIPQEEAFERNPYLKTIAEGRPPNILYWYYCDALIDNKCSLYDQRPYTCSEFPWYLGKYRPTRDFLYSEDCGYMGDVLAEEKRVAANNEILKEEVKQNDENT